VLNWYMSCVFKYVCICVCVLRYSVLSSFFLLFIPFSHQNCSLLLSGKQTWLNCILTQYAEWSVTFFMYYNWRLTKWALMLSKSIFRHYSIGSGHNLHLWPLTLRPFQQCLLTCLSIREAKPGWCLSSLHVQVLVVKHLKVIYINFFLHDNCIKKVCHMMLFAHLMQVHTTYLLPSKTR